MSKIVDAKLVLFWDDGRIEWQDHIVVNVDHNPGPGDTSPLDSLDFAVAPFEEGSEGDTGGLAVQLQLERGLAK